MQQIFNFLYKNSIFLLFLLLLGISLIFTIQSHSYHRSRAVSSANAVSGYVYEQVNNIKAYFNLREQNQALAFENARLQSLLYNTQDTANRPEIKIDPAFADYKVIQGKVIKNAFSRQKNYLTLNIGYNDGVRKDMGVLSSRGVVGYIEQTSANYATVISVLNKDFRLGAKIKKNNHFGTLTWNGKNTGYAQLTDVPRLAEVTVGDTIVTGAESTIFPENIPIGTIYKVNRNTVTNYFELDIKLFNDMTSLDYIYIVENKHRDEIIKLEEATTPTTTK
ncbi:rod shape-determining protein MreC [Flavobacterium akiainvivens]|uniref:Cell shape-determining protein MreC n=1 Tax=Flavobacterium akiainvivens TaxID=1202724 RepID=A0A0M8MJW9_9FLAO|nr:rod shape-determining protein MreC [Flavobacterium akiainvivens]KOS07721.1 rod shape-determining protein MreC [Flavobacterium akiainvivens]SFQ25017.1 rod shape-determining protein MreC [Flavobacterium akiainvivens]